MRSEFLESEMELYVQRLLVHESYNTGNRYRMLKISPIEERLKGYDAQIIGLASFYCQFKTSDLLSQGKLYKSRESFLKLKGWPCSPFYSFALRVPNHPADKKNHQAWQHNILHHLWKTNPSGVAYVAPAFHTRVELELIEPAVGSRCCPLMYHRYPHSGISVKTVDVNGYERCRLPFFEGLISIPPHLPVKDLKHRYGFTSHRDITFHSNPELVEGGKPFGAALRDFVLSSTERDDEAWTQKISVDAIRNMLGNIGGDDDFLLPFINYGLSQMGIAARQIDQELAGIFEEETFIRQHVALAASLQAYFGISTLGLLKVEEQ